MHFKKALKIFSLSLIGCYCHTYESNASKIEPDTLGLLSQENKPLIGTKHNPVVLNQFEFAKIHSCSPIQHLKVLGDIEKNLRNLKHFNHLISLDLSDANRDETATSYISVLTRLEFLNLNSRKDIRDNSLKCLTTLKNLKELEISSTLIYGPGLSNLSTLTNLEKLNASHTHITGGHLTPLINLPKLIELNLSSTFVDMTQLPSFINNPYIVN